MNRPLAPVSLNFISANRLSVGMVNVCDVAVLGSWHISRPLPEHSHSLLYLSVNDCVMPDACDVMSLGAEPLAKE